MYGRGGKECNLRHEVDYGLTSKRLPTIDVLCLIMTIGRYKSHYIRDWIRPIDADGCEVENGSRAAHDIKGHPRVTQGVTQLPDVVVHLNKKRRQTSDYSLNNQQHSIFFSCICASLNNQQTDQTIDQHTDQQPDQQTGQQIDQKIDQQTDEQTDQKTGKQTDQQTDHQTDQQTDKQNGRLSSSLKKSTDSPTVKNL